MTTKILVLAANPEDTTTIRVYPEIREIEDAINNGNQGEKFSFKSKVAVRVEDLQKSIRGETARIVHFCGHGTGSQGLILETTSGQPQLLDTQALADLFKLFATQVECVVLNACFSEVQAQAINQHINYVISTRKEIRDDAAIAFSQGFYEAIADGETIERAFYFGKNRIQLEIYGNQNLKRKLVPVITETGAEKALPEHEVLKLNIKDPLNEIENATKENIDKKHIHQEHSGSGDNVAGNKIENFNQYVTNIFPNETEPTKQKEEKAPDVKSFKLPILTQIKILLGSSFSVTIFVIIIRFFGVLQSFELSAYDFMLKQRPPEGDKLPDKRLLIIGISPNDKFTQFKQGEVGNKSLSDSTLNNLLDIIIKNNPKIIGLDLARDFPTKNIDLMNKFKYNKKLIGVCKEESKDALREASKGFASPKYFGKERVGFADILTDNGLDNGVVRRHLLFKDQEKDSQCNSPESFSYLIAQKYLREEEVSINHESVNENKNPSDFLGIKISRLYTPYGGYQSIDFGGYQTLLNYRAISKTDPIAKIRTVEQILDSENPENIKVINNKIVLIGVVNKERGIGTTDILSTPYGEMPGIYVHAHMISQLLSAVLDKRPMIKVFSQPLEMLFIFIFTFLGGILAFYIKKIQIKYIITIFVVLAFVLCAICYVSFLQAIWIPLIPPLLSISISIIFTRFLEKRQLFKKS